MHCACTVRVCTPRKKFDFAVSSLPSLSLLSGGGEREGVATERLPGRHGTPHCMQGPPRAQEDHAGECVRRVPLVAARRVVGVRHVRAATEVAGACGVASGCGGRAGTGAVTPSWVASVARRGAIKAYKCRGQGCRHCQYGNSSQSTDAAGPTITHAVLAGCPPLCLDQSHSQVPPHRRQRDR